MFERIEKEYLGFFVALYACEMGELGDVYLGHYKIFTARPTDFWVPGHIAADIAGRLSASADEALADARELAMQHIRRLALPRTRCLTARATRTPKWSKRSQPLRTHSVNVEAVGAL